VKEPIANAPMGTPVFCMALRGDLEKTDLRIGKNATDKIAFDEMESP